MSCHKSFVPQCSKIYPGLFDIVSCLYDLMSLVVTPLKSFVTTLLFSCDNYQPFTFLTKEQLKTTVTGSFFLGSFFLSGLSLLFFSVTFSLLGLLRLLILYSVFGYTSDACSFSFSF